LPNIQAGEKSLKSLLRLVLSLLLITFSAAAILIYQKISAFDAAVARVEWGKKAKVTYDIPDWAHRLPTFAGKLYRSRARINLKENTKLHEKDLNLSSPVSFGAEDVLAFDLKAISSVPSIKSLAVHPSADLSALSVMPQIESLGIFDEAAEISIKSLQGISSLNKLQELYLFCQITSFSSLLKCTSLERLMVYRFPEPEEPLSLPSLKYLRFSMSDLKTTDKLSKLTQLEELDISSSDIKEVEGLKALVNLRKLNIAGTRVSDLSPLAGLSKLKELDISHSNVKDTSVLEHLKDLTIIDRKEPN